ncbi:MAG: AmmeMemoRadiSam system protein B [Patescibacteria group bacterium]
MKSKEFTILFLGLFVLVLIILISVWLFSPKEYNRVGPLPFNNVESSEMPIINLREAFYEPASFAESLALAQDIIPRDNILGIIVPHHLVSSSYTAELIKMSSGRKINNVVVIGPNHQNIGSDTIATVQARWEVPDGFVTANKTLVSQFMADFNIFSNKELFKLEHSIGAIVPFINHYFSGAEILPIAFSSYASIQDARDVSSWLLQNLGKDSLIIISVDFSHYLTKDEADEKDKMTKQLILDSNIEKIIRLDNDNVDSPASLTAALLFAKEKKLKTSIYKQANSFDFANEKPSETTSYFFIAFEEN